jgi:hypothetical protein
LFLMLDFSHLVLLGHLLCGEQNSARLTRSLHQNFANSQ